MAPQNQATDRWKQTFLAIWAGMALSRIGSSVAQFALVWWLTDLTGSAAVLAGATALAFIPQVVLGPLAGAYVDRWNRRVTMIVSDATMALLALGLAWLFWTDSLQVWHVYVIIIGRALGDIFHFPATQAATVMLVPGEHLPRVHGLNQTLNGAIQVLGPALGALAISLMALHHVMLLDVATACAAILPLLWVRIPQPERATTQQATSIWRDTRDGIRYLWALPGIAPVIALAVVINFFWVPTFAYLPLYVRDIFGGNAAGLGMIQAFYGAGLILGGLLLSGWGHRVGNRVGLCFGALALWGLAGLGAAVAPASMLWALGVAWFLVAMFNAVGNGTLLALFQGGLAPEMQGRANAALSSMVAMAIPLGLAASAPVADHLGLRYCYLFAGAVGMAGSLWALSSPRVRALNRLSTAKPPLTAAAHAEPAKRAKLVPEAQHDHRAPGPAARPAALPVRRNAVQ